MAPALPIAPIMKKSTPRPRALRCGGLRWPKKVGGPRELSAEHGPEHHAERQLTPTTITALIAVPRGRVLTVEIIPNLSS